MILGTLCMKQPIGHDANYVLWSVKRAISATCICTILLQTRACEWSMSGAENGAEWSGERVSEKKGCSGMLHIRERTKSALLIQRSLLWMLFSVDVTRINRSYYTGVRTGARSAAAVSPTV